MLIDNESVTALIPNVLIELNPKVDKIRLKLSDDGVQGRTLKIYCQKCLNLEKYGKGV